MRRYLIASTFLSFASLAHAQTVQSLGGMNYYLLPASGGCTAANPCSVVTYLSVQSESQGATLNDLNTYFGGAFAQANPHTIVIAPVENGPQDATTNWGGYSATQTPEGAQMIAIVQSVEASMGNTVNPAESVVTGGSLGGTGTQNALAAYGPKGIVQPGVFSAGESFDAALWTATNPAVVAALCGVPLTAVHGTADTNQSISYDQNLAAQINGNPACGNSFNLVPVQGAGHGTWSGSSGYQAGTGAGTPLAWISSQLSSSVAPAAQTAIAPVSASAVKATATSSPVTAAPSQITPGSGSVTDAQGHVWAITAAGRVTEDGALINGGGDTSALTLVNGVVWGKDNGNDASRANSGGWFTLGGSGWNASATPPPASSATATAAVTTPIAAPQGAVPFTQVCTTAVPTSAHVTGGFGTLGGQIYSPNGQPWKAYGIDVHDYDLASDADGIMSNFPNTNLIRVAVESLSDEPASFSDAVNKLTSKGVVVEFTDYTNSTGQNWGGGQGTIYTGSQLAAESAWYSSMASYFKDNPYVWLGTNNEPSETGGSLSQWHLATYNAIRGAGNINPILVDPSGWSPSSMQTGADPSVYAQMTNIIWDPHIYSNSGNPTVDSASDAAWTQQTIAQTQSIQSADGIVPVIIGEYGIGGGPNPTVMIPAVLSAVASGQASGSAAWAYDTAAGYNVINDSGSGLSAFGALVNASMLPNAGNVGCAQSTVLNSTTAPDLATASTAVTAPALGATSSVTAPDLTPSPMSISAVAGLAQ